MRKKKREIRNVLTLYARRLIQRTVNSEQSKMIVAQ